MRVHRLFTPEPLEPEREAILGESAAHHLGRVLRAAPGRSLVLFNGDSHDYAAEVVAIRPDTVIVAVQARLPAVRESWLKAKVVQAVSRGERMDQTLQKCTELGATAFQPLVSERVEVRLRGNRLERRQRHWRAVVIAACEQCGRAVVPEISPPLELTAWLESEPDGRRLVLQPGSHTPLSQVEVASRLELVVGPEGGFSGLEYERMDQAGVQACSLGPRILRTETAAPAALAILQARAGDM